MYASEKDYWKKKYPWQYPSGDLHPDQRQAYLDSYHNASTRAALLPQDGYLSGGQFAEEAKLDGRKLTTAESVDRINPFTGHYNQQEYRDKYNPDGSLRNAPFSMMDYLNPAQASLPQEPQTKPALDTLPVENLDEMGQGTFPRGMLGLEDAPQGDESFIPPVEERPFNKNGILQGIGDSLAEDDGTGSATNNSRSHTATAEEIKAKKEADDRRNEMLIRVGGAIVGASGRGGLAAIDAGTKEYGRLADYNRALEQQEKEKALAKQQKLDGLSATERKANQEAYNEVQTTITNNTQKIATFEGYIDALDRYGDGVTGPIIDKLGGKYIDAMTPGGEGRTMLRLGLEEVAVDKALQKIAQTKGAISDREMKLFLKPTPKLWMDEGVWKLYLQIEVETAKIINARLAGAKNADGTLVNRIDADREMDAKLKALYDQYMGLHGAQKAPDSDISDDNDELFNF